MASPLFFAMRVVSTSKGRILVLSERERGRTAGRERGRGGHGVGRAGGDLRKRLCVARVTGNGGWAVEAVCLYVCS